MVLEKARSPQRANWLLFRLLIGCSKGRQTGSKDRLQQRLYFMPIFVKTPSNTIPSVPSVPSFNPQPT